MITVISKLAKICFGFLETQGSTIDSIYGLLLLSSAPQDSIDTTVSKMFIFSSFCIYKKCKNKL